jgi:PAS domain S-box-containing protein
VERESSQESDAERREAALGIRPSLTATAREHGEPRQAARASERQLQLVTDALPVLVSHMDADQRYRFASAAYERWFGWPNSAILGKHLKEVLGASAYATILPYVERALAGEKVSFETELTYLDGSTRFVEATYVPQVSDQGERAGFVALVNDITERKAFERFRAAAANRSERLSRITAAIADAVSAAQVFQALVDSVSQALGATSAALWVVDDDGQTARLVRSLGYSDTVRREVELVRLDQAASLPVVDSLQTREAVWVRSQAELHERYPQLAELVPEGHSCRACCLPLIAHGEVLGALALTIENTRELEEEERSFLLLTARYASQALERLRLFDAARRSHAQAVNAATRIGVLSHASRAFVETDLDLASRLPKIVSELAVCLASCVGIALLGPDGCLHPSASYHPLPEAHQLLQSLGTAPLPPGKGVMGWVVSTGKSVLIPSAGETVERAAPGYRAFLEKYPVYALMCSPLRARGKIIGTVMATRTEPGETYTASDLELFEQLAERAASAIENSQLYEETVAARMRAEQLYRFAQAVVVADRVESVFDAALGAIEAALGAKRAAILTMGNDAIMRFAAWRNLSDTYRSAVEGHSPWAADASAPEPVLVSDPEQEPSLAGYLPLFRSEGIGALAFVPLVSRGQLLGKFMVYYEAPHKFEPHEVKTATSIANHLASVVARFSAMAALEETIRSNELFAGVLAHDLRNPLGAIMTAAQVLLMRREGQPSVSEGESKPLGRILSSGQRMTRMIEQLLDFSRARGGGGIELSPRETDLAELCAEALGEFEVAQPTWKVRSTVVGDPRGSWDSDRLLQLVSNLVANAGQHGSLDAGIDLRLDGSNPEWVKLEVHNEGVVPSAILPHLFDPFRTARQGRGKASGLGLGLFIVREIVRAHGGTVDVQSSDPHGTTFSILLPRRVTARRNARGH